MNVLFCKATKKCTGFNRPVLPFEFEIQNVKVEELSKTLEYIEKEYKTDEEGNKLYLFLQEPLLIQGSELQKVIKPLVSDEPVIDIIQVSNPVLGENGEQVEYEVINYVHHPAVVDEEGNVLEEAYTEEVPSGIFIPCFTIEEVEEQRTDEQHRLLYWHEVEVPVFTTQELPPLEITENDENYSDELENAMVDVVKTKVVTFEESPESFTYDEVSEYKGKFVTTGTFYAKGTLYENPEQVMDTSLSSFKADLGFGLVSIPAGGVVRTVKLTLPTSSDIVRINYEVSDDGLIVEIGRLASNLIATDIKNEVKLDTVSSEVYVRFTNLTDKRIDLQAFSLLVV